MTQLADALAALALQPQPLDGVDLDHTWVRDVVAALDAAGADADNVQAALEVRLTAPQGGAPGDVLTLQGGAPAWRPAAVSDLRFRVSGLAVLRASFDDSQLGALSEADLTREFGGSMDGVNDAGLARTTVVADGDGRAMRVEFPPNESGGAAFQPLLPADVYAAATLSYRVRFSPGFDFSKGGKIPGLAGVAAGYTTEYASGGDSPGLSPPDFGPDGTNAWSARMMWREGGAAVTYLYWPGMGGAQFGIDKHWDRTFVPGQWHTVETTVTMNTPGISDGSIATRFDGVPAYAESGLRFRDVAGLGIDRLYFSTFRGGSDATWYSPNGGYIEFDDFVVRTV